MHVLCHRIEECSMVNSVSYAIRGMQIKFMHGALHYVSLRIVFIIRCALSAANNKIS